MKQINVELSVTRNLGDYNSVKVQAGYTADVNNEQSINDAYAEAWSIVEDEVEAKITEALTRS